MKYRILASISGILIVLIFFSQAYLVYDYFNLSKELLRKEINLITNEAYRMELNNRLNSIRTNKIEANIEQKISQENKIPNSTYDIDKMKIDKKDIILLLNSAISVYANEKIPFNLQVADSIVGNLLKEHNINSEYCTELLNLNTGETQKSRSYNLKDSTSFVYSNPLFLDFEKEKSLQIVLLNPQQNIFKRMSFMLIASLLFSLFCIYCIWSLQQTLSKKRKLIEVKNNFFNTVSHELKRPVSQIFMSVNALWNPKIVFDESKRQRYLSISKNASKNISEKIDIILAIAKEEEGVFKLNKTEFDLSKTIFNLKDECTSTATKPVEIEIENKLNDNRLIADEGHITQCIANLIENAIKYSEESVAIKITLNQTGSQLSIAVKDNGLGIDKNKIPHIFEKFNRASIGKVNGFGIGLFYVKTIIEKHHGKISITSKLGEGSEFVLILPKGIGIS